MRAWSRGSSRHRDKSSPRYRGWRPTKRSRHRRRARPPGPVAEGDLIRIALEQADVVNREAEAIGRDLTECDLVPLPVRMRPRNHGHLAITVHAHDGAFPAAVQAAPLREIAARPGAGLVDEGGKPDSHQTAFRAQPRLFEHARGDDGELRK